MSHRTVRRAAADTSAIGADPDDDVYVVPLADIVDIRGWHVPARVVIDATGDDPPSLPVLAQIVLVRRRLRAAGGDVVIAASPETAAVLRSTGLHWAVPCWQDVSSAVDAMRPREDLPAGGRC